MSAVDYGPLAGLTGVWRGDKGQDISPEPDGSEQNHYTETICFTPAGDVDNAETQELAAIQYHLKVHRIPDGKAIHDQTGYWIWDAEARTVMHGFTIPRGVAVLAGGVYEGDTDADGNILVEVAAAYGDADWSIIQAPFMREHALTTGFRQHLTIAPQHLSYRQVTRVDIYDYQGFEHSDENELERQLSLSPER